MGRFQVLRKRRGDAMITDRVGDFIVRLQNAVMAGKREVHVPHSAHLFAIAKKLKQLGFLTEVKASDDEKKRTFLVSLAYDERGVAKLRGVNRVSKPGRRLYTRAASSNAVKGGTGARLISTSVGILSDVEARKGHVGGEEMFEIW